MKRPYQIFLGQKNRNWRIDFVSLQPKVRVRAKKAPQAGGSPSSRKTSFCPKSWPEATNRSSKKYPTPTNRQRRSTTKSCSDKILRPNKREKRKRLKVLWNLAAAKSERPKQVRRRRHLRPEARKRKSLKKVRPQQDRSFIQDSRKGEAVLTTRFAETEQLIIVSNLT